MSRPSYADNEPLGCPVKLVAERDLDTFSIHRFMFWAPTVRKGLLVPLREIEGLELVVNADFTARVRDLEQRARKATRGSGNPFYRALQILAHLRA